TGREVIIDQLKYSVETSPTIPVEDRDSAFASALRQFEEQTRAVPWLQFFMSYDPVPTARSIRGMDVLILQGGTDRQVTSDQATTLADVFRSGENNDVTVRVFPNVNHLMLPDPEGSPARYSSLPDGGIARELLGAIVDWV